MTMHRLEVVFKNEMTIDQVETLKDAIHEFLDEYASNMSVQLEFDLVVLDA